MDEIQIVPAPIPDSPPTAGPVPFEYAIELLADNEKTYCLWETRITPEGYRASTLVTYPTRCSVCLELATKKELFSADPNYRRPLCDKDAAEKPDLNMTDRTKLTALQEQRLRKSQPTFALHKVTGIPMVAELHRIAQIERHREHNPTVGMPKAPKKGHMPKKEQAIKSAALRTFRRLIAPLIEAAKGHFASLGQEYQGVPVEVLGKVGARAGELAIYEYIRTRRARRARRNRSQQFSRQVNAGLIPGNTNRRRFGC